MYKRFYNHFSKTFNSCSITLAIMVFERDVDKGKSFQFRWFYRKMNLFFLPLNTEHSTNPQWYSFPRKTRTKYSCMVLVSKVISSSLPFFFFFCLLTVVICQNIVYFHCYQYLAKHLFQMFLMRHNAPETKLHQGNLFYVNLAVFESRNPCECSMDCPALENPHKVNLTSWKLSMYRRYGLSDILRIVKFC